MSVRTNLLSTATILALAAAPLTPALAQSGSETDVPEQTEQTEQAVQYSESDLESFVDAAMKVMALRQTYEVRLQAAENQDEQQELVQQAEAEMKEAIEETDGIDVSTYTEIGAAAQENEELNQRVVALFQERMPTEGDQPSDDS